MTGTELIREVGRRCGWSERKEFDGRLDHFKPFGSPAEQAMGRLVLTLVHVGRASDAAWRLVETNDPLVNDCIVWLMSAPDAQAYMRLRRTAWAEEAPVRLEALELLTEMPPVEDREPYDHEILPGALESLDDWVRHNEEPVEWFLENAGRVRALLRAVAGLATMKETT